jgi:hypothetical protein
MAYPSGGVEQMPQSAEYATLRSYADTHTNDAPLVASTPFPSSAEETTSMAQEGLVPGLGQGPNVYAGAGRPVHN